MAQGALRLSSLHRRPVGASGTPAHTVTQVERSSQLTGARTVARLQSPLARNHAAHNACAIITTSASAGNKHSRTSHLNLPASSFHASEGVRGGGSSVSPSAFVPQTRAVSQRDARQRRRLPL